MGWIRNGLLALLGLAVLVALAAQFGLFRGAAPGNLGVRDGKLKPPSKTPNSVSSQADLWPDHPQRDYARIEPLFVRPSDAATVWPRLKAAIAAAGNARIVIDRDDYLHVEFTTRLMKYTDDAEFWFDRTAGVIHVRSASRLGRKDFGVNRERIEALRRQLAARA